MRVVTSQEISSFKVLPYDIYDELGTKMLDAGDVLTPGKIMVLKTHTKYFTNVFNNKLQENIPINSDDNRKILTSFSYETLDPIEFDTIINTNGTLDETTQVKLKYYYKKVLDLFSQDFFEEGLEKLHPLVKILLTNNILKQLKNSKKGSQVRFLGEYALCHPLNVAITSALIARKFDYSQADLEQLVLAALLHDIGKFLLKTDTNALLEKDEQTVAEHTKFGYYLIKNRLKLPEAVAKVAFEHHENNDGSGYPRWLSSDFISEMSQIVNVANYYDNLACNRTPVQVRCNRDALRGMLEVGTKKFSAKILYTFIYMFAYNDIIDFSEMTL